MPFAVTIGERWLGFVKRITCKLQPLFFFYRCVYEVFVGQDFLSDLGFDKSDFDLLCGLTSWATCGTGRPRETTEKGATYGPYYSIPSLLCCDADSFFQEIMMPVPKRTMSRNYLTNKKVATIAFPSHVIGAKRLALAPSSCWTPRAWPL